jgi:hypothetical protein
VAGLSWTEVRRSASNGRLAVGVLMRLNQDPTIPIGFEVHGFDPKSMDSMSQALEASRALAAYSLAGLTMLRAFTGSYEQHARGAA